MKNIKYKKSFSLILLTIVILSGYVYLNELNSVRENLKSDDYTLNKCVDGDTFWLKQTDEVIKIRLSGVNTPETTNGKNEAYGQEASTFTCNVLKNAKTIKVEYDTTQKDSYNRKIAVVFVDEQNLNILLVQQGYADLRYLKDSMPYSKEYKKALKEAENKRIGIHKST